MKRLVALLLPLLTACWSFDKPLPDEPPNACTSDTLDLDPTVSVDYVELRAHGPIASTGEACATYDNREWCLGALEGQFSAGFANAALEGSFLVTTTGGDVSMIDDEDSLRAFLGTIDTPGEALLLVTLLAAGPSDANAYDCTTNVVATDDGYDVWAWAVSCRRADQRPMKKYHVTHDGVVSFVSSETCPAVFEFPDL